MKSDSENDDPVLRGVAAAPHIAPPPAVESPEFPDSVEADELAKVRLADRYQIEQRIGAGGMGVVYTARDIHLGRAVAVKVVRPRLDSPSAQDRLVREARAMAKLRHPNVATVYDIGSIGNRLFIVMELVDGGTVADWLAAKPRSWRAIAQVFLQAAHGLAAAHAAGFVHRDFKPENVLIGKDGVARVSDFGVARMVGEAERAGAEHDHELERLTTTGAAVGTPGYIAPEILRNESVDSRADQFSFCVALYAALFAERPFEPREGQTGIAETLGELRPHPRRGAPRWLQGIIARGLSAEPGNRWPSVVALATAIERRLRPPWRALALAAAAIGGVALALRPSPEWRPIQRDIGAFLPYHADGPGLAPDGKLVAYLSRGVASDRGIFIDSLSGGKSRIVRPPPDLRWPRWTRDGRAILG